jgi:hypothetical protein
MPRTEYILKFNEESDEPIQLLKDRLKGRNFDFVYWLSDGGGETTAENQKLADCVKPISPCTQKRLNGLTIATEGPENDLFVSKPEWDDKFTISFLHVKEGIIRITNGNKDWFEFRMK